MFLSRTINSCTAAALAAILLSGCGREPVTALPTAPGQTLRIVSSLPFKGQSALQSTQMRNAINLAIDERRELLSGWAIEHVSLDGGDDETGEWSAHKEAANARAAAGDPSVMAYIGPYASGGAMVSMPILNEAGLLQALPAATWPGLTQEGWGSAEPSRYYPTQQRTMVRFMPPDSAQASVAARNAHQLRATSVLVVMDESDYSKGMAAAFRMEAAKLGMTRVGTIDVGVGTREWATALGTADAVFVAPSSLSVATEAAKHIARRPPPAGVFVTDVLLSDRLTEQELALMEGWQVVFNGDLTPGDPARFGLFSREFEEHFGAPPSQYAMNAYDATTLVLEAAARVGKDRRKIIDEVLTGVYEGGAGGPVSFDTNGDIQRGELTLYRLVHGEFVATEELPAR